MGILKYGCSLFLNFLRHLNFLYIDRTRTIKGEERLENNYCKCNCGTEIKPTQTWVMGHQFKGIAPPNKGKGKQVELHPCVCGCGELVIGEFKHGHGARVIHWSKGPKAEQIKQVLSEAASERTGEKSPRYGKTKETNPAFSNGGCPKGTIPYNKGNGDHLTPEKRQIVTVSNIGKPLGIKANTVILRNKH